MVRPLAVDEGDEPAIRRVRNHSPRTTPMDRWTPAMNTPASKIGMGLPSRDLSGRVLIVGGCRDSRRLARTLRQGPWPNLPVVGFIDAGHSGVSGPMARGRQLAVHPQAEPVPVVGRIDRLEEWVDRFKATHLVVALSNRSAHRIRRQIDIVSKSTIRVHWINTDARRNALTDAPVSVAAISTASAPRWDRVAKRLVDFLAALVGLLILSPLFLVVSLLILIGSGRPIFYMQERVGQGGRLFKMFKFRSMRRDAEGTTGPIWASTSDDRCTKIGAWLRRTNIDELPQLFNVLRGEMSLVGPRPERPIFVERFRETVPDYDLRHAVPGGMTGWAQVHGWRGRTSLRKRVQYDLDYIQRWSFWIDFRVLFMTIQHVAFSKIRWEPPKSRPRRPVA
jgi:exopolysaccharide biosynthesis polyprenyl glycosylphosphotransferase